MKKIAAIRVLLMVFVLMGCGVSSTVSTNSTNTSTDSSQSTTSMSTSFVNPFIDKSYIRHVTLNDTVLSAIASSSGRIAYLDDTLYVAYDEGLNYTKYFVIEGTESLKIDPYYYMSYEDHFLFQYDTEHDVLYGYENSDIYSHPNSVEDEVDFFPSRSGNLKVIDSSTFLIQNQIRSFTGDILFDYDGTLVMPSVGIGQDSRLYTYKKSAITNQGCIVHYYNTIDSAPVETIVHDEYTCDPDFDQHNEQVVIPLMSGLTMAGVATIASDGIVRHMIFADAIPDYDQLEFNSFHLVNDWLFVLDYEDSVNELHNVAVTIDLSSILIDELNASMATKTRYADESTRFYMYSTSDYRLYQNNVRTYTYTPRNSAYTYVDFLRDGDFGVIIDTNWADGEGRLTRIDLTDLSLDAYDKSGFSFNFQVGGFLALRAEGDNVIYDITNDVWKTIPIEGAMKPIGDDGILFYTDDLVTLYDIDSEEIIVMNRIGEFRQTLQPYAFLVEYQGNHYVVG